MEHEKEWLRANDLDLRLDRLRLRRQRATNAAFSAKFRRGINVISVGLVLLIVVSAIINWPNWPADWVEQFLEALLVLSGMNVGAWILERLMRHVATDVERP